MTKKIISTIAVGLICLSSCWAAVHIAPGGGGNSGNNQSSEGGGEGRISPRVHNAEPNVGAHNRHEYRGQRNIHAYSATTVIRPSNVTHTRIVRERARPMPVPEHHAAIVNNATIVRSIQNDRRAEIIPNHAYWHTTGGVRYVHTYRGGIHWYGFYHGSNFYWTRYYRNRWWWYDPGFSHWVFWANGYWWWNGPGGVAYVYENDSYYPYNEAPVQVTPPPTAEAEPVKSVDTENNGGAWTSSDGKRMIQIQGPQSEAFLYDKTGAQPRYLAYLGTQVDRVRFSGGTEGRPLKILVDFKNGDFSLFSSEGEPLDMTPPDVPSDAPSSSATPDLPPTPPTDIPN